MSPGMPRGVEPAPLALCACMRTRVGPLACIVQGGRPARTRPRAGQWASGSLPSVRAWGPSVAGPRRRARPGCMPPHWQAGWGRASGLPGPLVCPPPLAAREACAHRGGRGAALFAGPSRAPWPGVPLVPAAMSASVRGRASALLAARSLMAAPRLAPTGRPGAGTAGPRPVCFVFPRTRPTHRDASAAWGSAPRPVPWRGDRGSGPSAGSDGRPGPAGSRRVGAVGAREPGPLPAGWLGPRRAASVGRCLGDCRVCPVAHGGLPAVLAPVEPHRGPCALRCAVAHRRLSLPPASPAGAWCVCREVSPLPGDPHPCLAMFHPPFDVGRPWPRPVARLAKALVLFGEPRQWRVCASRRARPRTCLASPPLRHGGTTGGQLLHVDGGQPRVRRGRTRSIPRCRGGRRHRACTCALPAAVCTAPRRVPVPSHPAPPLVSSWQPAARRAWGALAWWSPHAPAFLAPVLVLASVALRSPLLALLPWPYAGDRATRGPFRGCSPAGQGAGQLPRGELGPRGKMAGTRPRTGDGVGIPLARRQALTSGRPSTRVCVCVCVCACAPLLPSAGLDHRRPGAVLLAVSPLIGACCGL
ncbi:hypothetical protein H696_05422 [Fonticula alba]|uniref:Uncharacterized protein n=1 Tax=Fonticula alba TaxID=691883 RepID=A0A058Z147_FONAL|nr:hypothetical protein H696_05422 [Fonticula alba]KCV67964.1 hypothetical protein H696_05422 [Fonticula alba]|eukprot:XP_009497531.1 hypothetical protein H696_05422 [Fonticula alba]